jgi:hypothetical protein
MHPLQLQHIKHTYQYISLNLIYGKYISIAYITEVIHVDSISYRLNQTQYRVCLVAPVNFLEAQ